MGTIGLIAAMPLESDALLRCIKAWKRFSLGGLHGQSIELYGQTFLLLTSGMGMHRAGQAARMLAENKALKALISFGIAGAVGADMQIGDVIAAEAACLFEHEILGAPISLASWPDTARQAASQALTKRGAHLFTGATVTTGGSQIEADRLESLLHPVLEMETVAIAQVAAEKGIPFFSLRAISDSPLAPLPSDLFEMMDEDANLQYGKMLRVICRRPRLILQVNRMMRNSRLAADNAAVALIAALSQMSF